MVVIMLKFSPSSSSSSELWSCVKVEVAVLTSLTVPVDVK